MKAFLFALVALAVLSVGADLALDQAGFSAEETYKTSNVRLPEPKEPLDEN